MALFSVSSIQSPPVWTPAGHDNIHAWFAAMHAAGPMGVEERSGMLQIVGHEAVRAMLADAENWSSAKRLELLPEDRRVIRLLTIEPPVHDQLRTYFQSAYRPKRLSELEGRVQQLCDESIDVGLERGELDVIADFAQPLTLNMISEIIGVPLEERGRLRALTRPLLLGAIDKSGEGKISPASLYLGGSQEGYAEIDAYFKDLIARRRQDPRDDLVSDLARVPESEVPPGFDVAALLFEQYVAGISTTVHLIGSILSTLDGRRDQLAKLRANHDLISGAIEETLRYHAPLQARTRVAARDFEFMGEAIREGTYAIGWLQGANLDPAVFENSLDFNIERGNPRHVTFGFGPHFCLGFQLGRLQARIAMRTWLAKIGEYERAESGPLAWADDFIGHGLDHFHVRVRPH